MLHGTWDLSYPTRDGTHVPRIGRGILYHWTTRAVLQQLFINLILCTMYYARIWGYNRSQSLPSSSLQSSVFVNTFYSTGHFCHCQKPPFYTEKLLTLISSKSPELPLAASFGFQVTALTLLKEEDFPSLGCLLDREFSPLSRLLVLLGWTHCQSLASAKRLLQTLHRTQVTLTLQPKLLRK